MFIREFQPRFIKLKVDTIIIMQIVLMSFRVNLKIYVAGRCWPLKPDLNTSWTNLRNERGTNMSFTRKEENVEISCINFIDHLNKLQS